MRGAPFLRIVRNSLPSTLILCFAFGAAISARSQTNGILGRWAEPEGSTIVVERCGEFVCARLVGISKSAPAQVDGLNPNASLRNRPLCGLQIGTGFKPADLNNAADGKLYDPKSGKTYSGSMQRQGDQLALRGYVGLKVFGRTELWKPANPGATMCAH